MGKAIAGLIKSTGGGYAAGTIVPAAYPTGRRDLANATVSVGDFVGDVGGNDKRNLQRFRNPICTGLPPAFAS